MMVCWFFVWFLFVCWWWWERKEFCWEVCFLFEELLRVVRIFTLREI